MSESKEMEMLKELLRDTVYGREFDTLAFMANNTCEALTHLREWIAELQDENKRLRIPKTMSELELIKCEDCQCNIKGECFRLPPAPHFDFAVNHWNIERPLIRIDGSGCFAGIPKSKQAMREQK